MRLEPSNLKKVNSENCGVSNIHHLREDECGEPIEKEEALNENGN